MQDRSADLALRGTPNHGFRCTPTSSTSDVGRGPDSPAGRSGLDPTQAEYNDGQPWPPLEPGQLPTGKPLGAGARPSSPITFPQGCQPGRSAGAESGTLGTRTEPRRSRPRSPGEGGSAWWRRRQHPPPATPPTVTAPEEPTSEQTAARTLQTLVAYGRALASVPNAAPADARAYVCGVGLVPSTVLLAAAAVGDAQDVARAHPHNAEARAALAAAVLRLQEAAEAAAK